MSEDALILLIATGIADLIVLFGWLGLAAGVWVIVSTRTRTLVAQLPEGAVEEPQGPVRWLLYGVSLLFWPAALGLSIYFLTRPETVRAGRVCVAMLLLYVTFSVLLAIGIVTGLAVALPDLFL